MVNPNDVTPQGSPFAGTSLPPMSIYSSSAMLPPTYLQHGQMMQLMPDQSAAAAVVAAAAAAAAGQQVGKTLLT